MTKMPSTLNPIGSPFKRLRNIFIYNTFIIAQKETLKLIKQIAMQVGNNKLQ